ncbi:phosphoadenosine phosphosulfate reductase [Phaeovulum sp. NW3]|uniref:phosphoadenosine phosphosulfate reductase n=1 Tax=Phaeovulum sp. NW3 TaxID=2934933 RepID=UPI0020222ED9|nr:phosphoadenosine phosphosulfate reductase [Phaeovulum sp. NW3]MCL7466027.1 phosphoadenosine phosphosulfate reductase [Phaeovulum sp. NW3]
MEDNTMPMRAPGLDAWQARIEEIGEDEGYYQRLGPAHAALFADAAPVLLVSFESRDAIRAGGGDQLPFGLRAAQKAGWSSLTLIADHDSWFRDPKVYGYFDRLVDEAFFEDFDRVVFYGAGPGGYAAAAFSVAAPGCTVVALQPQATLDPRLAGWDTRFSRQRRADFTTRYGYAPDMIEAAARVLLIHDPLSRLDAMHAALFRRPHVITLPCPGLGDPVDVMLAEMGVLEPLLALAMQDQADAAAFWRLYRARRDLPRYLRALSARLDAGGRIWLNALLCRNAAHRLDAPRFRARLATLEEALAQQGRSLPPMRGPGT